MKKFLATLVLLLSGTAQAHEYTLQFTPPSGAKEVTVVGYAFTADGGVSGLIHYPKNKKARSSFEAGLFCLKVVWR